MRHSFWLTSGPGPTRLLAHHGGDVFDDGYPEGEQVLVLPSARLAGGKEAQANARA